MAVIFTSVGIITFSLFVVGLCDQVCFDTYCYTLTSSTINRTILAECACSFQLPSAVKDLTHVTEIDQENCTAVFSNPEGSRNVVVNPKGPSYQTDPAVVYDDALSSTYSSLRALKEECNLHNDNWLTTKKISTFIWDFGALRTMTRVEFRNYHYSSRHVIDFEVSVSRYSGISVTWANVLRVENLEKPTTNCEPIRHYSFKPIIGRQIRFTASRVFKYGAAMNFFRVY